MSPRPLLRRDTPQAQAHLRLARGAWYLQINLGAVAVLFPPPPHTPARAFLNLLLILLLLVIAHQGWLYLRSPAPTDSDKDSRP